MRSRLRSQNRTRPRRHGALLLVGLGLLGFGPATDAVAQVVYGYGYARAYPGPAFEDVPPMPPRAIVYRLYDRGFTEIARPRYDGRAYVVDATSPAGDRIRLFLDARDGAVLGRQRLDTPYYPSGRVARAAPAYGWTEEDRARPRGRDADMPVPPADIPLPRPSPHSEAERGPGPRPGRTAALPSRPDAGIDGLNPDASGRAEPHADKADARARNAKERKSADKSAKLTPPAKPAAPSATSPAPPRTEQATKPVPDSGQTANPPATTRETAKTEEPKAAPAPVLPAAKLPAEPSQKADRPDPAKTDSVKADSAETAEKPASGQEWHDPPADGAKRNVRVIGGATLVPGSDAPAAGAN